jgi:hypothetical protein
VFNHWKYSVDREFKFVKKELNFNKVDGNLVNENKDRTKLMYDKLAKQFEEKQLRGGYHLQSI